MPLLCVLPFPPLLFPVPFSFPVALLLSPGCNTAPCASTAVQAQWLTRTWSRCSKSCQAGGGTSTRQVLCVNTAGQVLQQINEAQCAAANSTAGAKPPTMQVCGRSACATFQPVAKDWSSCSVTCGGGVQTRLVQCVDQRSRSVVRASFCDLSSLPTSQTCNTSPCSGSSGLVVGAVWQQGDWSECSTECGGGFRTRAVQCVSGGNAVDASQCTATMPATQSTCSTDQVSEGGVASPAHLGGRVLRARLG